MKLTAQSPHRFDFQLSLNEKALLRRLVGLYPLVPEAHHQIQEGCPAPDPEKQELLREALAAHRGEARQQARALLNDPARFVETPDGHQLHLSPAEMEWLLQILNDVRVGSWLTLGEPESLDVSELPEENAAQWIAMEAAGYFESALLEALGVRQPQVPEED